MKKDAYTILSELKNALDFVGSEAKGFVHNISPDQVIKRAKEDNAIQMARNNASARSVGFPGGVSQYRREIMHGKPFPQDMLTSLITNIYHSIKNIL